MGAVNLYRVRVDLDLEADTADVLGDRGPALPPTVGPPDPLEQIFPGEHPSRRGGEE